ncbi:hypothetical protein Tco_0338109, partial [Tanacetum coccineum]
APFLNVHMMSDHNSSELAPQRQEMSVENVSSGLVPQGQKASDYENLRNRTALQCLQQRQSMWRYLQVVLK